jgi:hypothetical protein
VARRLFGSLECWSNLDGNRPTLPVTLSTLDEQRVVHRQPMPIDTGFAGEKPSAISRGPSFRNLNRASAEPS